MTDLNSLLASKMQEKNETKMRLISERENSGFSGVFKVLPLGQSEEEELSHILSTNNPEELDITGDLAELTKITAEVKAINSQAIILHGERIKKAQTLLKRYKEGAFTSWLVRTYGNRQTPYNFLQYYDFYTSLSEALREKMMDMPKQAIYTLASRSGDLTQKKSFVKEYKGETKRTLLAKIREIFPLPKDDKRVENISDKVITTLYRLLEDIEGKEWSPSQYEVKSIQHLLSKIKNQAISKT